VFPDDGGWFRLGGRRKTLAEDLTAVVLSLELGGDRFATLTEAWNASSLGPCARISWS
jgi:hypothetical protein